MTYISEFKSIMPYIGQWNKAVYEIKIYSNEFFKTVIAYYSYQIPQTDWDQETSDQFNEFYREYKVFANMLEANYIKEQQQM